jgi:NAD+ synthase
MDFLSVEKKIESFIQGSTKRAGARGVVVGLSGGVDSAVVAALASRSLGPDSVLALIMPTPHNSSRDVSDAKSLAKSLGIRHEIIPLKGILNAYMEFLKPDRTCEGNLAARIRMSLLYYKANLLNYLVAGTGNRSELSVGYFTKYGDGGCDILPIGCLYKTQVWGLAASLGIPKAIIDKPPSAGLWPGQTDEGDMNMSYEELDSVLTGKKGIYFKIQRMINSSEHKRKLPETCKI